MERLGRALQNRVRERGQGLVETAIVAPILIFMLIGVFEVGWALRGYLVLINANREAARFAVRPNYLDYNQPEPNYAAVVSHTFTSLSNQIPFQEYGTIIVSHFYVAAGWPCNPKKVYDKDHPEPCDCDAALTKPFSPTIFISPANIITWTYTWPATSTKVTRLDYDDYKTQLIRRNIAFNCALMNHGPQNRMGVDSIVVVEMYYDQPQLFGFPLISNPLTDPVPMYSHTAMRILQHRELP